MVCISQSILLVVSALAMSACVQPELRGGVTAAQLEEIKSLIRAETHHDWIKSVTLQKDGSIFVETLGISSYRLRRVKNHWEVVEERIKIQGS